ncbi:phosphopantetheine-containing protein [Frankia torreyi]|uniref:Phosphopantetheine-containing protein n=1 Tax=Frankia torreyi TaxID=1856 RepID=A0A0D8B616_9ACTN|nr:phosphopantetheine-binding protein [Frankia torreyi]KJE19364.1 phosphopantetheine-containing protein [Frankia torreyi]
MSREQIEDLIIELMAAEQEVDPAELRCVLEEAGPTMPVDSVLAVAVLVEVEERFGVRLPADVSTAEQLRSVTAFADAVLAAADENIITKRAS